MMVTDEKLHFLIVDDNNFLAEIHKSLLEDAGYKVTLLNSAEEALKQFANLKVDCIISDLLMPHVDGFDLFENLRKIPNIKQPIFIILTGKIFDFDHRKAIELGVDGYLTKPVNPDTFVSDLMEIIKSKRQK